MARRVALAPLFCLAICSVGAEAAPVATSTAVPETIHVSGRRHGATRPVSSIEVDGEKLRDLPFRTAEDALRLVPGLTLVQHGSEGKAHQFFLRGFDAIHGSDLEISVEGIPVNEMSNIHAQGYLDLGFVIPETIRAVEVTKGPFDAAQGPFAMAGSARYRLGMDTPGWRLGYTAGTTQRHRGVLSFASEDSDSFAALEALHDDGFGARRSVDRGVGLGRWVAFDEQETGRLVLTLSAYHADFELPGTVRDEDARTGDIDFYDSYDEGLYGRSSRGLVALEHEISTGAGVTRTHFFGSWRELTLLENYTGFLYDAVNGDRRHQWQQTVSMGLEVSHAVRFTDVLEARLGAGGRAESLVQRQSHLGLAEELLERERWLEGWQGLAHLFAAATWQALPQLRASAGLRLDAALVDATDHLEDDAPATGTLIALSPRAALEWRPLKKWEWVLAYGRGARPPEARAFTSYTADATGLSEDLYTGGEPAMTVSDAFELGTRWSPDPRFTVGLSGFATFIERESIFDHVSGLSLELNGTRRLGAELSARWAVTEWLELDADVTAVDARFVASGNRVPLAPWLVGSAHAFVHHESGFRAGLRYFGLAPRPLPHGATGSLITLVDASAGYAWDRFELSLDAENLLAREIREGEYHYASAWAQGEVASEIPVTHYVAGAPFNLRLNLSAGF